MGQANSGPHWQNDEDVSNCNKCQKPFTVVVRKHHCRGCGMIFCSDCSGFNGEFPSKHVFTPARLCESCYNKRGFEKHDARSACQSCNKDFGSEGVTKELCRNCGKLTCGACAPPSKGLPAVPSGVRICPRCVTSITELGEVVRSEAKESSRRFQRESSSF